ncbi:MAG: hypothetical protein ACRDI2_02610 [Chloroflexota bacterium]
MDRALIEIGEPGVLERPPTELATLEARLFGAVAFGAVVEGSDESAAGGAGAPEGRRQAALPAVRVLIGEQRGGNEADDAQSLVLRSQFRVIHGGLQT